MARIYPYRFKEEYRSVTCVYKIHMGSKFIIWKALNLKQGAEQVCKDLDRKVRLGCNTGDFFCRAAEHIKRHRPSELVIEVLLQSDNHAELIEFETKILNDNKDNPSCLNINISPYIPAWIKMTANKALGSIKNDSEVLGDHAGPENKPEKLDLPQNQKTGNTPTDKKQILEAIKKMQKLKNG
jgi:hypothetical protein